MLLYWYICIFSHSTATGFNKVKGVSLGGWLVVEKWIKPSLFDGIPNGDMLDGYQVQFKSVTLQKYVSASNGGGMSVTVDRDIPSAWETFKIWRVSANMFQFKCFTGQFLTSHSEGNERNVISATADWPSIFETYIVERNGTKVHIKLRRGNYLQVTEDNRLTANYYGEPGWDDNSATFEMVILPRKMDGEFQLANGYGQDEAKKILSNHWNTFVTAKDFRFLAEHGINTVKIPVGWWIVDPHPPAPFVGGALAALDKAFSWARNYNIRCIIDLHAAPGSQNGFEHSASRDGSVNWPLSPSYISQSLDAIEFLCARYADNPAFLGIELLNGPLAAAVPLDILVSYYKQGYQIVRKYSSTAYVIVCQRTGTADPMELVKENIGDINVVIDVHYYNLFSPHYDKLNSSQNIESIYRSRRAELEALNSANGPLVFVGEWVNEWNVRNASQLDYQKFGRAQLEVYDTASFGWSFWTLKSALKHWDFQWSIKNEYLVLD